MFRVFKGGGYGEVFLDYLECETSYLHFSRNQCKHAKTFGIFAQKRKNIFEWQHYPIRNAINGMGMIYRVKRRMIGCGSDIEQFSDRYWWIIF